MIRFCVLLDNHRQPSLTYDCLVSETKKGKPDGEGLWKLSTALIQRGTLTKGAVLVSGDAWAKVRALFNDKGQLIQSAPPSTPVEVVGWRELPSAGEEIIQVESEKLAHEIMKYRQHLKLQQKQEADAEVIKIKEAEHLKKYKMELEERRKRGRYKLRPVGPKPKEIIDDTNPRLCIIIKGDVNGSVEAILDVLDTYDSAKNSDLQLDLVHYGVGEVIESDLELAEPFGALIYTFNVSMAERVAKIARKKGIRVKEHNVIYRLVDDLKERIKEKLPPKQVEEVLGEANVIQEFLINEGKKKVPVAGCRCVKGVLKKSASYRLIRGEDVLHEVMENE
ncbi:hypothetical protein J437_LFUL014274 [Ladona fulva]|uniref:Translation initiation factor IF-2, mitochondrial n=1 Tax=Ladona fulva TaxID=123851 RepID=A0A8K0KJA0_LADFU|nr:hypothetical protein J437_LFUL014274 [Ladona fulva]